MGGESAPMPYKPANEAGADAQYTAGLNSLSAANTGTLATAGAGYDKAYQAQVNSPYAAGAQAGANTAGANGFAAGTTDLANAAKLGSYAPQIEQSGFDPQSANYNRQLKGAQDSQSVANAQSGVAGSPFGAGMVGDATQQFQQNWQAGQQQRQQAAISALSELFGHQSSLAATGAQNQAAGAALPQQTYTDINQQSIAALTALVQGMGNASTPLQRDVQADGTYLGIGQSATDLAAKVTSQNNKESGIMGALGAIFSRAEQGAQMAAAGG